MAARMFLPLTSSGNYFQRMHSANTYALSAPPPLAWPSSLVMMTDATSTFSLKALVCSSQACPMVASITNTTLLGFWGQKGEGRGRDQGGESRGEEGRGGDEGGWEGMRGGEEGMRGEGRG